jgi:hypothetical protein
LLSKSRPASYCDMTPESRSGSLLDGASLSTYPW